uniref:SUI1 domain-containing protein n=1 Tax=Oreochromis aureus TaxID=47969 RepID=A0A668UJE2_OREAU
MSAIQNLQTFDPFADATKGDDRLPAGTEDYIHIRIQQRNGRKTLTTVQGISADYDKKKLVKAFKKYHTLTEARPVRKVESVHCDQVAELHQGGKLSQSWFRSFWDSLARVSCSGPRPAFWFGPTANLVLNLWFMDT